jgi:hypothetical protein
MTNGAMLVGEVRIDGQRVALTAEHGEMLLRRDDIAAIVDSVTEAYRWRRDQIAPGAATLDDHCRLAEWCLRNDLPAEAAAELTEARAAAPNSQRVALLERRLSMLHAPAPRRDPAFTLAAHEAPTGDPDPPADAALQLPEGGLEFFTRRVQPVLVNNCTAGGCHLQENGGAFALDRRLLYGYADGRSTQHNLRTALSAIDASNPQASPLLRAAKGGHHGASPLVGGRRAELLDRIEAWVTAVAAANAPPTAGASSVTTAGYDAPLDGSTTTVEHASAESDSTLSIEMLRPARLVRGGALVPAKARDEFDPEVFNREFRRPLDDEPLDASAR